MLVHDRTRSGTARSIAITTLLLIVLAWRSSPAEGQASASALEGQEVRVVWHDPVFTGGPFPEIRTATVDLISIDEAQLVARQGDRLMVLDTRSVRSLKHRIGTRPATAPEMVAGSAGGFLAGFLLGMLDAAPERGRSVVDAGLSTGVLVGAPAGALVAWMASRSRGIYEDVEIPRTEVRAAATVAPTGAVALAFEVPAR